MTFTLAVAAGGDAGRSLNERLRSAVHDGAVSQVAHEDLVVAWDAASPFVSTFDDGELLVVLDGSLHEPPGAGTSQAHLLLERYRRLGSDVAGGILGDFVLVVLDRPRSRLLVARDPVGVRPWYQATSGLRQAGASDAATLCALPWVDDGVDELMALAYLAARAESRGETLHRGVRTLTPGTTWQTTRGSAATWRHHAWQLHSEHRLSWADAVERCRAVLDEAVRCRVEVAGHATSELSGGLDSSAVVGTAARLGRDDLLIGRLVFSGHAADERDYSDAVIQHWDVPAVSAGPWLPTEDEAAALTARLHRPPPDPNFTMFADLHRGLLLAGRPQGMTGLGGDDAFVAMGMQSRLVSAVQLRQGSVLRPLVLDGLRSPRQAWQRSLRPTLRHLAPWVRAEVPRYIARSSPHFAELTARVQRPPQRLSGVHAVDDRADNITTGYHAHILEEAAIVSDLVGRRSTHPFLDPRLITATYGLNPSFPVLGGHDRALQVAAYEDRLPEVVARRRSKAEFSEVVWARPLSEHALERLVTGPLVERGWLDVEQFQNVLTAAARGQAPAALPLSRAIALDRWLRQLGG